MLVINELIAIPEHALHFQFSRSSGPGGQNVNKVNSKALLYWRPCVGAGISEAILTRFLQKFANKMNADAFFFVTSDRFRDRLMNQEDCLMKLREAILSVVPEPKLRKRKKPSFSSIKRRQESKRLRGQTKASRRRVRHSD